MVHVGFVEGLLSDHRSPLEGHFGPLGTLDSLRGSLGTVETEGVH